MPDIHEQIAEAFRSGADRCEDETPEAFLARNSAAARTVYELTRSLGLKRQTFADAPAWKPREFYPPNAFAKRYFGGLLGDALPGYPFDKYARARVARGAPKKAQRTPRRQAKCPHCGGKIAA